MKKILPLLLGLTLLSGCAQPMQEPERAKLQIVTTVFPAYDFARAVAGDLADVTLLLPPGMESHSYEPTPADILAVQECDLFICLGGDIFLLTQPPFLPIIRSTLHMKESSLFYQEGGRP